MYWTHGYVIPKKHWHGIHLIYFSIIVIIYELQAKSSYLASFNLKLTSFEAIYITHYLIQKVKKWKPKNTCIKEDIWTPNLWEVSDVYPWSIGSRYVSDMDTAPVEVSTQHRVELWWLVGFQAKGHACTHTSHTKHMVHAQNSTFYHLSERYTLKRHPLQWVLLPHFFMMLQCTWSYK
jgi:hypothetical protein